MHVAEKHHHAAFAHPPRNVEAFAISPGSIVADFGAGSGAYTFEIAKNLNSTGRVYSIDVQDVLVRRIKNEAHRRRLTNVEPIWGDIERPHGTKIGNGRVDIVLMSNILFQLECPLQALDEARRVLKMHGTLIVIDWSDSFGGLGPTRKHVVTKEQALEWAREAGFQLIQQFQAGAHHYGLVLHKSISRHH